MQRHLQSLFVLLSRRLGVEVMESISVDVSAAASDVGTISLSVTALLSETLRLILWA